MIDNVGTVGTGTDAEEFDGITAEGIAGLIGNLNLIHFNIRSLNKNFNELLLYLHLIGLDNVSVIVLSECWNSKIACTDDYCIPGFTLHTNESQFNQNDGCAVYIREDLEVTVNVIPITNVNLLRLVFKYNRVQIGLTASYRPHPIGVTRYVDDLDDYFASLNLQAIEVFMGDTNIDLLRPCDSNVLYLL